MHIQSCFDTGAVLMAAATDDVDEDKLADEASDPVDTDDDPEISESSIGFEFDFGINGTTTTGG